MKDSYDRLRHSKTLLMAHVIFVTKYRHPLTAKGIWKHIKQIIRRVCKNMNVIVLEIEEDNDHIHMLMRYPPAISISHIVSRLKQQTTYDIWKHYACYLRKLYWKEHTLWSDGYFACSIGNASEETIRHYIQNQG